MHVLILASYGPSLVNFRGPLMRELIAGGHKVSVASPGCSENAEIRAELESIGAVAYDIPLDRTGTRLFKDIVTFGHLVKLVWKVRPDTVLAYTIKPVIYGTLAARVAGVRRRFALITGLGFNFTENRRGLVAQLIKYMYGFALGGATKVFLQNRDDKRLLLDLGILSDATPTVIVNGSGIDLSHFEVAPLPIGPPRFLMICRFARGGKGVREYVAAARKLRDSQKQVSFRLIGWIDQNPGLHTSIGA